MSLDVRLTIPDASAERERSGIFIRDRGETREISRAEWDERNPGREPVVYQSIITDITEVFHANVTHNLCNMAAAAGIYEALWRPEEIGITKAAQLIGPLEVGLLELLADPAKFEALNPENGWGSYERFVPWVKAYLAACLQWPHADVRACR